MKYGWMDGWIDIWLRDRWADRHTDVQCEIIIPPPPPTIIRRGIKTKDTALDLTIGTILVTAVLQKSRKIINETKLLKLKAWSLLTTTLYCTVGLKSVINLNNLM